MLAFLKISQDYIFPKMVERYPCLGENRALVGQMLRLFEKKIPHSTSFLKQLQESYDESAMFLSIWQSYTPVSGIEVSPATEIISKSQNQLAHLDFEPCGFANVQQIYLELAQLWTAFIALKVTNDEMSIKDYKKWLKSSKKEINKSVQNFGVGFNNQGLQSQATTTKKVRDASSRYIVWSVILLFMLTAFLGYLYFQQGGFQNYPDPFEKYQRNSVVDSDLNPDLSNIDMIYENGNYYLSSNLNGKMVELNPESKNIMDSLYVSKKIEIDIDSLNKIEIITKLNDLDGSLFPLIIGDDKVLEKVENRYPESIFLYAHDSLSNKTLISLKKI